MLINHNGPRVQRPLRCGQCTLAHGKTTETSRGSPDLLQRSIHLLHVKRFRIEGVFTPLQILVMLRVIRVANRFQKGPIAPDTASIFWRTMPLPREAVWVSRLGLRLQDLLQKHLMVPSVAEVIFVEAFVVHVTHDLLEPASFFVDHVETVLWIGLTVVHAVRNELVEMRVRPTHRDLEDLVEFVEGRVILDLDASPHRGLAVFKRDLELVDHGSWGGFFGRHGDAHMRSSTEFMLQPPISGRMFRWMMSAQRIPSSAPPLASAGASVLPACLHESGSPVHRFRLLQNGHAGQTCPSG